MKKTKPDITNKNTGDTWIYTQAVKEHFFQPKNLLLEDPEETEYDAQGMVGSPFAVM